MWTHKGGCGDVKEGVASITMKEGIESKQSEETDATI